MKRAMAAGWALALALAGLAPLAAGAEGVAVEVEELSWIAGGWVGRIDGAFIEERWSDVAGGAMMGMFRLVSDGAPVFYELMTIEPSPDGPVLRLRHFDPGLVAWEEKAEAKSFRLIRRQPREFVFEDAAPPHETRLSYHRSGRKRLTVTLETVEDDGPRIRRFEYVRAR